MLPTHMLGGMLLAVPLFWIAPELAIVGLVGGMLGGAFPDFDMYVGHRRTLHFPVYYPVITLPIMGIAAIAPHALTVGVAFFLLGAAVHSISDIFGGGLELRPWEATSDRAVFDHFHGRWIRPRRFIPYDGSIEDLFLAFSLSIPLLFVLSDIYLSAVISIIGIAILYTVLRRRLARMASIIVKVVPTTLLGYVPPRYLTEEDVVISMDRPVK